MNKSLFFKWRLYALFLFTFSLCYVAPLPCQSWRECIEEDVHDTLYTGMPVALSAAVLWAIANRIPTEWKIVDGEVAEFVYTTWEKQGFEKARTIILKRIPKESILFRLVVYTQDLPGALAIGEQFIEKIQMLLDEKNILESALAGSTDKKKRASLQAALYEVEEGLDECRFVCGHERVHKEKNHTYTLLVVQFLAPFFAYSFFKYLRKGLVKSAYHTDSAEWLLEQNSVRSATELLIGWIHARRAEYDADKYASSDIKILRAGLRLFKKALAQKSLTHFKRKQSRLEFIVGFCLKYSHPGLSERIVALEECIKALENKKSYNAPCVSN